MNSTSWERFELWRDGLLPPEEAASFEQEVQGTEVLRVAAVLQDGIDDAIRRRFPLSHGAPRNHVLEKREGLGRAPERVPSRGVRAAMVAATILLGILFFHPPGRGPETRAPSAPGTAVGDLDPSFGTERPTASEWTAFGTSGTGDAYQSAHARSMGRIIACTSGFNKPPAPAPAPDPWAIVPVPGCFLLDSSREGPPLSTTIYTFASEGHIAVVGVHPQASDPKPALPRGSELRIHRKVLGNLVIYEVSPAPTPLALSCVVAPGSSEITPLPKR